jgi:hypothetical protein
VSNHPVVISSSSSSVGPDVVVASPNSNSRSSMESQTVVVVNNQFAGSTSSSTSNNNYNYYMRMSDELGLDEMSLTYYEVEYLPFQTLLYDIGAVDGQIFYDLGCGVGKALIAASLSGIRFMKCIGVEILPSLSSTAQAIVNTLSSVQHLKSITHSHHSHYRGNGVNNVGSISNRDLR